MPPRTVIGLSHIGPVPLSRKAWGVRKSSIRGGVCERQKNTSQGSIVISDRSQPRHTRHECLRSRWRLSESLSWSEMPHHSNSKAKSSVAVRTTPPKTPPQGFHHFTLLLREKTAIPEERESSYYDDHFSQHFLVLYCLVRHSQLLW